MGCIVVPLGLYMGAYGASHGMHRYAREIRRHSHGTCHVRSFDLTPPMGRFREGSRHFPRNVSLYM